MNKYSDSLNKEYIAELERLRESIPYSASKRALRIEFKKIITGYNMWGKPKYSNCYKIYDDETGDVLLKGVGVPNPALLKYLEKLEVEIYIK